MLKKTKKSQFGFDTALVFLVVLLIIFSFNLWKKNFMKNTYVTIKPNENDFYKSYPLFEYKITVFIKEKEGFENDVLRLNLYDVIRSFLESKSPLLVNAYCEAIKNLPFDPFYKPQIKLTINDTSFEGCNDSIATKRIYFKYLNKEIPLDIGIKLSSGDESIYYSFYNSFKKVYDEDIKK